MDSGSEAGSIAASAAEPEAGYPMASSGEELKAYGGTATKRKRDALQLNDQALKKAKHTKSITAMPRLTPREVVQQRHATGPAQEAIKSCTRTGGERDAVSLEIAKFFYECGVPFDAANSRQFEIAVEAIAQYGSGYKPPSYLELRESLLEEVVEETDNSRVKHEEAWKQYGCTLMLDEWTDNTGCHLINFLVNSPEGTFFFESVDASSEAHDAKMLADLIEKRIENIGKDKVVQVVAANGANYKAVGKLLTERIPTLFWTPCAAHCLDLMLEDIGKLKEFKKPIARARHLTTFIYRHKKLLSAVKEKTCEDLVRPAVTQFATPFLTLLSLHKHKDKLKFIFLNDEWTLTKLAKTEAGRKVERLVYSNEFWNSVLGCIRASQPLLAVLQLVHSHENPAMPEVATFMTQAKEKIKAAFSTEKKRVLLESIMAIIDQHWVKQMDSPLYGAALYLNPGKFFPIKKKDDDDAYVGELRCCFLDVLERMLDDSDLQFKINSQALLYEDQRGEIFSNKMAIENIHSRSPIHWWRAFGGKAIELQRFAKHVVSLCASSRGCERIWSTFEFIHSKKRNQIEHKKLNDLAYVAYNMKMASRFQKQCEGGGKSSDHLVIEELDWDNEWINPLAEPPQGGRGQLDSSNEQEEIVLDDNDEDDYGDIDATLKYDFDMDDF